MERFEVELAVGDVLRIGDRMLTVVDIDGEEISFRVDEPAQADCLHDAQRNVRPR